MPTTGRYGRHVDSGELNIQKHCVDRVRVGVSFRVNEAFIPLGSTHYVCVPGSMVVKLPILPQRNTSVLMWCLEGIISLAN
jgi:hypothetical protein